MTTYLLACLDDSFDDSAIGAMREAVGRLRGMSWTYGPPEFVDDTDDTHNTQPGDQSIRTVGAVLTVSERNEAPETPREEVERLVAEMVKVSAAISVDIVFELGHEAVGAIERGVPDEALVRGLIEPW